MGRKKHQYPPVPSHIRITSKRDYEVTYIDQFKNDPEQQGECRKDPPQIVIKASDPEGERFSSFIHETIHALDFEDDIKLTEKQVIKLERGIFRILKLNGWI